MLKAIFIIAISCLAIIGITTLFASFADDGSTLKLALFNLRTAVVTLGLGAIAIIVIAGFFNKKKS